MKFWMYGVFLVALLLMLSGCVSQEHIESNSMDIFNGDATIFIYKNGATISKIAQSNIVELSPGFVSDSIYVTRNNEPVEFKLSVPSGEIALRESIGHIITAYDENGKAHKGRLIRYEYRGDKVTLYIETGSGVEVITSTTYTVSNAKPFPFVEVNKGDNVKYIASDITWRPYYTLNINEGESTITKSALISTPIDIKGKIHLVDGNLKGMPWYNYRMYPTDVSNEETKGEETLAEELEIHDIGEMEVKGNKLNAYVISTSNVDVKKTIHFTINHITLGIPYKNERQTVFGDIHYTFKAVNHIGPGDMNVIENGNYIGRAHLRETPKGEIVDVNVGKTTHTYVETNIIDYNETYRENEKTTEISADITVKTDKPANVEIELTSPVVPYPYIAEIKLKNSSIPPTNVEREKITWNLDVSDKTTIHVEIVVKQYIKRGIHG